MNKRHVTRMFLMAVVIAFISLSGQFCSKSKESTKVVRVIFDMDSATISYKDGKKIPVFNYDPREDITAGLKKAGFKVVLQDSKNYDLTLKITHKERARQTDRYPGDTSHKIMIDHIGLVLEDKDGAVLLHESRGPFSDIYINTIRAMTNIKKRFVKDLVELVQIRIEKNDETSCWIEFVSRRGDKLAQLQNWRNKYAILEKAGDPMYSKREEQIIALKPLIRSRNSFLREVSQRLLQALGYTPSGNMESAAFFIVQTYPFHRWSATIGEMTHGAWAARQGVIPVIRYGTTAIDLFVEDLKFKYPGREKAVAVLLRLSKERWAKFGYAKKASNRKVEYIDYTPQCDFFHVKYFDPFGRAEDELFAEVEVVNPNRASEVYAGLWNQEWNNHAIKKLAEVLEEGRNVRIDKDSLKRAGIDNKNYFQDVIDILGKIADNRAIQLLKSYLAHPKLAENAKDAIENIEKREK